VRADADSDFPVKPFKKIEQFVRGKAAKMAVHQVGDIRLGNTDGGDLRLRAGRKERWRSRRFSHRS